MRRPVVRGFVLPKPRALPGFSRQRPANRDSRQWLSAMRAAQNSRHDRFSVQVCTRLPALVSLLGLGPEISPQTQTAPLVPVTCRTNARWGAGCSAAEVLCLLWAEQQPRTTSAQALGILNFCLVNTKVAFRAHQYKPSPTPTTTSRISNDASSALRLPIARRHFRNTPFFPPPFEPYRPAPSCASHPNNGRRKGQVVGGQELRRQDVWG